MKKIIASLSFLIFSTLSIACTFTEHSIKMFITKYTGKNYIEKLVEHENKINNFTSGKIICDIKHQVTENSFVSFVLYHNTKEE